MTGVFRVPLCAVCGHAEGDHQSNRASFAGTLRFGLCLVRECGCREFVEDTEKDPGPVR